MTRPDPERRRLLAAAAGAAAGTWLPGVAVARAFPRTLDLADPHDALTAMIKMRGSLIAEDVPHWYFGTIYGVLPGRAPVPMVDFEGSEIDFYSRQPDGAYHAFASTVSVFRDRGTGAILESFDNPITGKRNEVRPNTISVDAYYIYSVNGFKRSDDERPLPGTPQIDRLLEWNESGEHIWLTMRRSYPAGLPLGEHQLTRGLLSELHDPSRPKVHTTAAPTYISPWPAWMDMEGHPGHTVWAGPARKLDSVKQYPHELLDFLERNYPEKLTARPG